MDESRYFDPNACEVQFVRQRHRWIGYADTFELALSCGRKDRAAVDQKILRLLRDRGVIPLPRGSLSTYRDQGSDVEASKT